MDEFCVKTLVHIDAKKGKISADDDDDDVCNTKVGDNYPGQGHAHEIISFFIAHSKAIHHSCLTIVVEEICRGFLRSFIWLCL